MKPQPTLESANKVQVLGVVLISLLLAFLPFHAFFATVIEHSFGQGMAFRAWKECILVGLVLLAGFELVRQKNYALLARVYANKIAFLIAFVGIVASIFATQFENSFWLGLRTSVLPLVGFVAVQAFARFFTNKDLYKLVLIPALVVAALAIIQPYVFTKDILLSIGYGQEGTTGVILAGQYIESAVTTVRSFSTLGGPNQLGTYLILPFVLSLVLGIAKKKWLFVLLAGVFALAIFSTYSRSAWLGAGFAVMVLACFVLKARARLIALLVTAVLAFAACMFLLTTYQCVLAERLPRFVVHGECTNGVLTGSDQVRLMSQGNGLKQVILAPLGLGLGAAGPASFVDKTPIITESWYLQIAIEFGVIGFALWVVWFVSVLKTLYLQTTVSNHKIWAITLFASTSGILVACMFLHSLADTTLVFILFSLLGIQLQKGAKL